MKRPAFQFYPGDWLRSADLRSCSVGARGLWIEMICLMHDGSPYGYLKVSNKVILPANLARMVGATTQEIEGWLAELSAAGVYSLEGDCIYSRRMVKDEEIRLKRAAGGHLGGNPALIKQENKVPDKVNLPPNLKPTPAFAFASALKTKHMCEKSPDLFEAKCLAESGKNPKIDIYEEPRMEDTPSDRAPSPSTVPPRRANAVNGAEPHPDHGVASEWLQSPDLFEAFWTNWPATDRRTQKAKCLAKWKLEKLNDKAEAIQQHVTALKRTEKWRNGFEPAPLTYLNGKHWEDGLPEIERQSAKEANDPVYQSLVEKFGSAKRRPDGRIYAGGRIFNSDGSGGLCL